MKNFKKTIPYILFPLFLCSAVYTYNTGSYMSASLITVFFSLIMFFSVFEKRQNSTGRLVLVSIITALSAAGRFIPFFKPVAALTIIAGIYLGREAGFMTGAFSAFISDFYFGQGPWTPFQMLGWGIAGYFAGLLSIHLKRSRTFLLLYGVVSGIVFSAIMDIWTVIWYNGTFSFPLYLTALGTALPHTVLYSVSNFMFLLLLARPFGEKLDRIILLYGI